MTIKRPYVKERYIAGIHNMEAGVLDNRTGKLHKFPGMGWEYLSDTARQWNEGKLTPSEAQTIAQHFMAAAAWASAPEGTRPRPTASAMATARTMAGEFVAALGVPLFRACLDAYEAGGLHPDCNGDPCAAFGNDLFLTLEGHGVGFWERDALCVEPPGGIVDEDLRTLGDVLTRHCAEFVWRYPCESGRMEFYRGWIYYRPAYE